MIMVLITALLVQLPTPVINAYARAPSYGTWPWARPGAYAVYILNGNISFIAPPGQASGRESSTLILEWRVVNVSDSGVLVDVQLRLPSINYSLRKRFIVTYDGAFYDARSRRFLGVWTLFRTPMSLVPGKRVLLAKTSPIAAAGAVQGIIERPRRLYMVASMKKGEVVYIENAVLPALRYGLVLERIVRVDSYLRDALKDIDSAADQIAEAAAARYPELRGMKIYGLPFLGGGFRRFLETGLSWLNIITPDSYDALTGVALTIQVPSFIIQSVLCDDSLTAIGLPDIYIEFVGTNTIATNSTSFIRRYYGLDRDALLNALHLPGKANEVLLMRIEMMLVDTNIFNLMKIAVASSSISGETSTAPKTSTAPNPGNESQTPPQGRISKFPAQTPSLGTRQGILAKVGTLLGLAAAMLIAIIVLYLLLRRRRGSP